MVSDFNVEDLNVINELGKMVNPNFEKLFHIDNLNDNESIFVLNMFNEIVGFIHISISNDECELLNIAVKKEYQNTGAGHLLMDYMISSLSTDVRRIILEVNETNQHAINLYLAFNFQTINIRKNYYQGSNGLVMEKIINE